MKANAPEKLYIDFRDRAESTWRCAYTEKALANDIEYIRKDAFVEKLDKWLSLNLKMLMNVLDVEYNTHETDVKDFIKDFREYMKGE